MARRDISSEIDQWQDVVLAGKLDNGKSLC